MLNTKERSPKELLNSMIAAMRWNGYVAENVREHEFGAACAILTPITIGRTMYLDYIGSLHVEIVGHEDLVISIATKYDCHQSMMRELLAEGLDHIGDHEAAKAVNRSASVPNPQTLAFRLS